MVETRRFHLFCLKPKPHLKKQSNDINKNEISRMLYFFFVWCHLLFILWIVSFMHCVLFLWFEWIWVVLSILSVCYSTTLLTFTTCFIVPCSSAKSLPLILCQTSLKFQVFFFRGGNFTFVWLGQFLLHKIIITIIIIIIIIMIIIIITLNILHFLILILIIIII